MFPHWFTSEMLEDGSGNKMNVDRALSDLILAVSFIAQSQVED